MKEWRCLEGVVGVGPHGPGDQAQLSGSGFDGALAGDEDSFVRAIFPLAEVVMAPTVSSV